MGAGIAQASAIHDDAGGSDLDPVPRKSREDLEDRRGVSGAGAGREVGAGTAEPSGEEGETGGDEPAAGQRQRHGTIEAAGERWGEVHAHKPAAHSAQEICGPEKENCRKKNAGRAADPLTERERAGSLHRK
jgi:hypothetical protein